MTIIEPNKNKFKINTLKAFIIGLILIEAALGIFSYNKNVESEYWFTQTAQANETLRIKNADLKNRLYALTDFQNAGDIAIKLGLIKEGRPEYLASSGGL